MNADRLGGRGLAAALALALGATLSGQAQATTPPAPDEGALAAGVSTARLATAAWSLHTPLGEEFGRLLVAGGEAGAWRLEVGLARLGSMPDAALLERQGDGWTFCAIGAEAFAQRWGEGWRTMPAGSARAIGDLIGTWLGDDRRRSVDPARAHRWRASERARPPQWTLPALASLIDGETTPQVDRLRATLVRRGEGRGGAQLAVVGRQEGGDFYLTSPRWPGRLIVGPAALRATALPAEAFLPLWPLADFLD